MLTLCWKKMPPLMMLMMKSILRKVFKAFLVAGAGPACTFAGANEGERQVRVPEDTPPGNTLKLDSKVELHYVTKRQRTHHQVNSTQKYESAKVQNYTKCHKVPEDTPPGKFNSKI